MNPILTKNFIAGAAVVKRRIVKFGADDDHVIQGAAVGDALFGVAERLDVAINKRVDVVISGIAEVEYGGAVTRGDLLTTDANGKAVVAARHTKAAVARRLTSSARMSSIAGVCDGGGRVGGSPAEGAVVRRSCPPGGTNREGISSKVLGLRGPKNMP